MAVTLNASTSTGLVQSADTSGIIELQNNGTTKLTVNSSGATIPTATVTTLNEPSGVLATQNGMTGIPKAWVRFTVSGTTPTVVASFNISSITYVTTGQYTFTFTTAMPNANYSAISTGGIDTGLSQYCYAAPFGQTTNPFYVAPTTTAFSQLYMGALGGTYLNPSVACVVVCGN